MKTSSIVREDKADELLFKRVYVKFIRIIERYVELSLELSIFLPATML